MRCDAGDRLCCREGGAREVIAESQGCRPGTGPAAAAAAAALVVLVVVVWNGGAELNTFREVVLGRFLWRNYWFFCLQVVVWEFGAFGREAVEYCRCE